MFLFVVCVAGTRVLSFARHAGDCRPATGPRINRGVGGIVEVGGVRGGRGGGEGGGGAACTPTGRPRRTHGRCGASAADALVR